MNEQPRSILRSMLTKGYKDVEFKGTFAGMRNQDLVVFRDIIIGKTSLTHIHIRKDDILDKEGFGRLEPGDRILMTGTPTAYTSEKHPDNTGVSLMGIIIVKRLNRTRKGKLHGIQTKRH